LKGSLFHTYTTGTSNCIYSMIKMSVFERKKKIEFCPKTRHCLIQLFFFDVIASFNWFKQ